MASGTIAYFVSGDTAHNVITTGGVDVELFEIINGEIPESDDDRVIKGVVPGQSVEKEVWVEATDESSECWVRVSVEIEIKDKEGNSLDTEGVLTLDFDTENWTEKDGLYYYNLPLSAGEKTTMLFTTVTFADELGNEYQETVTTITLNAQAVQTKNNGATALEAVGWPE
jgi:hypothetical protein